MSSYWVFELAGEAIRRNKDVEVQVRYRREGRNMEAELWAIRGGPRWVEGSEQSLCESNHTIHLRQISSCMPSLT